MKIIKINTDHYVVVDDSEIIEGDWLLDTTDNTVWDCHKDMPNSLFPECKKITHSTQPLESIVTENSFKSYEFISLQEVKELIGEVDVVELSKKTTKHQKFANGLHEEVVAQMFYRKGYNQALEDNKEKKYTEAQMRECWRASERFDRPYHEGYAPNFEEFIQPLQPKTEWEVEIVDGKLKLK